MGLLVNNAGIQHIGKFNTVEADKHLQAMEVNMLPYVMVTRFLLPVMMQRKTRSGVVMVSSLAVHMSCCPINGIYGATKAFDDAFARGLAYSVEEKVDVLSLKPGFVESNMSKMEKGSDIISAQDCASAGLN